MRFFISVSPGSELVQKLPVLATFLRSNSHPSDQTLYSSNLTNDIVAKPDVANLLPNVMPVV